MRRRDFIATAVLTTTWPLAARAQQSDQRMRRIGWLDNGQANDPTVQARTAAVREELARLGWVVGQNLTIDHRWGVVSVEMGRELGAELLNLSPDVIFCAGSPGVKALQQATKTVPIVFILVAEPVDQGFVSSLAHPGGNITGFAYLERTIGAKWLTLLTEIAPRVKHVAYMFSPKAAPYAHFYYEAAQAAAAKSGVQIDINPVIDPAEFEPVLARLGADGGVILNADAFIGNNLEQMMKLVSERRLPSIYGGSTAETFSKLGGLIGYSPDLIAQFRATAPYLDRILRGEKPADLPVQQPAKFSYVINLKTAKTLGLNVPLSMQMTADEVIE
jgi:putative tryptophan/tyrosine transport system substrate-binding protein